MEEKPQETVLCPYCSATIQKDSVYCPYCGERIKPIEYPSELKGIAVFEEASNIFGKNLSLCIISLLGMIVISVLAFLIIMPLYLSYFESFEEAVRAGLITGVTIAIVGIFVYTFIEGWIAAASSDAIQMGKVKLGSSLDLVFKKFAKLLAVAIINVFLMSPIVAWLLLAPVEAILKFGLSTYYDIMLNLIGVLIKTLFMFFIPMLIVTEMPFLSSLVKSIKLVIETITTDSSFVLIIVFYFLLVSLVDLIPLIGSLIVFLINLFIYPLVVLARVLYLKVNFSIF